MRALFLLCATMALLPAQGLQKGFVIGVPLTNFLDSTGSYVASRSNFTVGPSVTLTLPFGFSIEVDANYKRFNTGGSLLTGNSVDFPIMAHYQFHRLLPVHPFVTGGGAVRWIFNVTPNISARRLNLDTQSYSGVVFGGGVEASLLRLHIAPELRFTRWMTGNIDPLYITPNQVEFLVGVRF